MNKYEIKHSQSNDSVVAQYSVYVKGTALWLGTFSNIKKAIEVASKEFSNYPAGERVIYAVKRG